MNSHTIDAKSFQKLFLAGANRINSRKDYINELNVFPVPDVYKRQEQWMPSPLLYLIT